MRIQDADDTHAAFIDKRPPSEIIPGPCPSPACTSAQLGKASNESITANAWTNGVGHGRKDGCVTMRTNATATMVERANISGPLASRSSHAR